MQTAITLLAGCWLMAWTALGAAPANDAFENRFQLEGSSIVFTGTLAGATIQDYEIFGWDECNTPWYPIISGTVWWEWTAPVTTTVILEVADYSTNLFRAGIMSVYQGTNALFIERDDPVPVRLVGCTTLDSGRRSFLSFAASAGERYQIQLYGPEASFTLQLTATNSPHFLIQPVAQSASVGGSVFLGALAAGSEPISYQWRFNGSDLPGQTLRILSRDHLTTNETGEYVLLASNQFGVKASVPAHLFVSVSDIRPGLKLRAGNGTFFLGINGETGRTYRIESSTNLVTWQREVSFPGTLNYLIGQGGRADVVFNTNGAAEFAVPLAGQPKFFRASRYAHANDECDNNLKRMRFAKELWALVNRKNSGRDIPRPDELIPFMGPLPVCPEGGYWVVNSLDTLPVCTVPGHGIEEPEY